MYSVQLNCVIFLFVCYVCERMCWSEAKPTSHSLDTCNSTYNRDGVNTMRCIVRKGEVLDYREIRNWSEKESKGKLSFHISCEGGFVYLPWPFKAKNVISLEVEMCTVLGLLSEMTISQTIPDELTSLKLSNVSIEIPMAEMIYLNNNINHVQRNTDCGQLTLERLILKDIHYDLKMTPEERNEIQRGTYPSNNADHGSVKQKCVYNHLKYIDESGSRQNRQYYLKLIPEYSEFPVLEVYNMSNNDLDHIPESFRHLHSGKFPSLRHIDFSHNLLNDFEFDLPKDPKSCTLEEVNLSNNRITHISPGVTRQLKAVGKILVDLRGNPLRCSCGIVLFRQYLESLYASTNDVEKRRRAFEMTCFGRSAVNGKFAEITILDKTFDTNCNR